MAEFSDAVAALLDSGLLAEQAENNTQGSDSDIEGDDVDDGTGNNLDSELLESQGIVEQKSAAYTATPLGCATFKSSFNIDEATFVTEMLTRAQRDGLVLSDELHLCYLAVPMANSVLDTNWNILYAHVRTFGEDRKRIMERIGLDEGLVFQRAMSGMRYRGQTDKEGETIARRLFNALVLNELIGEVPVHEVARRFEVQSRGALQNLLQSAAMFAKMMAHFCRTMGWSFLEVVLQHYSQRMGAGGVKTDLLELMEIDLVASARARHLYNAGYRSVKSVAEANPRMLFLKLGSRRLGPQGLHLAHKIVASAQRLLRRKVLLLRHEADQLELEPMPTNDD